MSSSQTYSRLTEEVLEQHRQIHFYLDQIVAAVNGLREDAEDTEPMRTLAAQIESFRERLVEHQHGEEHGGLFAALLEELPEARQEVSALRLDHQRMVEILELARLHAQHGQPGEAHDLKVDLEGFLGTMREHERAEESLLARAMALARS
jgi:hypothetical protein